MWNRISSNKLIDHRNKQEAYFKHLKNLRTIKPRLNNSSPKHFSFLDNRQKARQTLKQRNNQIDKDNRCLVDRMLTTPSLLSGVSGAYFKDSLNSAYNKSVEKKIDNQNQKIVRRLQSAQSLYSQKSMRKSNTQYNKLKSSLAFSRMDPYYDLEIGSRKNSIQYKNNPNVRPFSAKK